jgi:ribonuclease HII
MTRRASARTSLQCGVECEEQAWAQGARRVAGVDEVGRGALFGPVVAAAVILDPASPLAGLNDSKQLTATQREGLDETVRNYALAWAVAAVDAAVIDAINIYQATRRAMLQAVLSLTPRPDYLLIDAMRLDWDGPQQSLIKGDARSVSIAAASIVAKVYRDRLMQLWDPVFPGYRLGANKGYSTADHLAALARYGPTPLHRCSFSPVSEVMVCSRAAVPEPAPSSPLLPFPADDE